MGLDHETNKELTLKHIRKNSERGTLFRELEQVLPSHSKDQIKVLMRELQRGNQIYAIGKTSSAKWFAN
jgi:ATP-dependent DNA helicase RecG